MVCSKAIIRVAEWVPLRNSTHKRQTVQKCIVYSEQTLSRCVGVFGNKNCNCCKLKSDIILIAFIDSVENDENEESSEFH